MVKLLDKMGQWYSRLHEDDEFEGLPWSRVNSLIKQFSLMPTFAVTEWTVRYMMVASYLHSRHRRDERGLFFGSLVAGVLKEAVEATKKEGKTWWGAQGSVMVSPNLSLHRMELSTVLLYVSLVFSRQLKVPLVQEAAASALFAHVLSAIYEINAVRFVWQSWHDDDPSVANRLMNVPFSSMMSTMGFVGAFSLLQGWLSRPEVSMAKGMAKTFSVLDEHHRAVAEYVGTMLDTLSGKLTHMPSNVLGCLHASATMALAPVIVMCFRLGALENMGISSARSYKLMLLLLVTASARAGGKQAPTASTSSISSLKNDEMLVAALTTFFTVQTCNAMIGDPTKHVSTGLHQPFGEKVIRTCDGFGNSRTEFLTPESPEFNSRNDFEIEGCKRAALLKDLQRYQEGLAQLDEFMERNQLDLENLMASRHEANEIAAKTERLYETVRQSPSLGKRKLLNEISDSTTKRVAIIDGQLEEKVQQTKQLQLELESKRNALRTKISHQERALANLRFDASGDRIIPAHSFGPSSKWYTIRGKDSPNPITEKATVATLSVLGLTAVLKAFS